MRFVAAHTHPVTQCPLSTAEGKNMLKNLFSKDNINKSRIKLVDAYMSCPTDVTGDHRGYFLIDANDKETVQNFFGSMTVDIREVTQFKDIAKNL